MRARTCRFGTRLSVLVQGTTAVVLQRQTILAFARSFEDAHVPDAIEHESRPARFSHKTPVKQTVDPERIASVSQRPSLYPLSLQRRDWHHPAYPRDFAGTSAVELFTQACGGGDSSAALARRRFSGGGLLERDCWAWIC